MPRSARAPETVIHFYKQMAIETPFVVPIGMLFRDCSKVGV